MTKTFYNTGKPCKWGHYSDRYQKTGMCVECEKHRVMKWRESIKSHYNDYQKGYTAHSLYHLRRLLKDENEIYFSLRYPKRKVVIRATPKWVNKEDIRRKYNECLNSSDGMNFHFVVDHIIPISNPKVCGLHVAENLQVVSISLNQIKGNKFDVDMAERDLMKWLNEAGKLSSKAISKAPYLLPQPLQRL